jgi:hypothetical protein
MSKAVDTGKAASKFGLGNWKDYSAKLTAQLTAAGRGGLLAYGVLNTLYYTTVTAITWYLTGSKNIPVTSTSYTSVVRSTLVRLGKVMGVVWTGSQVTKPLRLSGAIVSAPFTDKLIGKFQKQFNIESYGKAYSMLLASVLVVAITFYATLILGTATVLSLSQKL